MSLALESFRPFNMAVVLSLIEELHQFRMDGREAFRLAQTVAELAEKRNFPFWRGTAFVLQGWAEAQAGRTSKGVVTVNNGIELFRSTQQRFNCLHNMGY